MKFHVEFGGGGDGRDCRYLEFSCTIVVAA